jgi:hypothetical protein
MARSLYKYFVFVILSAILIVWMLRDKPQSPFDFKIAPKENLSYQDTLKLQELLNSKQNDLEKLVRRLYPKNHSGYAPIEDFLGRCLRGVRQILADPAQGWVPEVKLEKINDGGNRCFVTAVPYLRQYPELARSKTDQLQSSGFNGYYLYFVGGYPNPTGNEIQYVGVPYSMKIFAMMEAQKRGFQNVIWLDSAAMPLRDPSPLFECLENNGAFIHGWQAPSNYWTYVFPETKQLLKKLTGTDVTQAFYINSVVFGLRMNTPLSRDFIGQYFHMLKLGTPFLSCFPEECVLAAIYGQKKFRKTWRKHQIPNLIKYLDPGISDTTERIEAAREDGFYFYQLNH